MATRNALSPQLQLYDAPGGPDVSSFLNPLMAGIQRGDRLRQQGVENDMNQQRLGFARNADARATEDQTAQREQRRVERLGALSQMVDDEKDPVRRQQMWQGVTAAPGFMDSAKKYGIPTDHVAGPRAIAAMAGKYMSSLERQKQELGIQAQKGQIAVTGAQLTQLKSQTPEYRAGVAEQYGMTKGTPAYNSFVISGQYSPDTTKFQVIPDGASVMSENPRTGQARIVHQGTPKIDSTSRKAIYEAQDELPNISSSLELLNEAKVLLPKIYTGFNSAVRSTWNQGGPGMLPNIISDPERSQSTQRFDQIMNAESINTMSQTLKGASTDKEMAAFVKIYNDPNVDVTVKEKILDSIIRRVKSHHQNKVDRIKELGGRMPGDGAAGTSPAAADPLGIR